MIYDCFTFFNELTVLEIRLHELARVVDYFVLVESTHTFTGIPKPLHFDQNKEMFSQFKDKIIHVISENPTTEEGKHWDREAYQRNQIMQGLNKASPEDLVIIGDVDEIPKASVVKNYKNTEEIVVCELYHTFCYLNLFFGLWHNGTRMLKRKKLETPQKARFQGTKAELHAGWHFGWIGDEHHIVKKLASFSHVEYNRPPYNNPKHVQERITVGKGIYGDGVGGSLLPNEYLPEYVQNNIEKFIQNMFKGDVKVIHKEEMKHRTG